MTTSRKPNSAPPLEILDQKGNPVITSESVWKILNHHGGRVSIDFSNLPLPSPLLDGFKLWLTENLKTSSTATIQSQFSCVRAILENLGKEGIQVDHWTELGSTEMALVLAVCRKRGPKFMARFRAWRQWASWCSTYKLPGFQPLDSEISDLTIGSTNTPWAVTEIDPINGPLSFNELEDFVLALSKGQDRLSIRELCLIEIALHLGPNSGWVAALSWNEFKVEPIPNTSEKLYSMKFPRGVKTPGASSPRDRDTPWRGIDKSLGANLERLREFNRQHGRVSTPSGIAEPIFPMRNQGAVEARSKVAGEMIYFPTSSSIATEFSEAIAKLKVLSDRTGHP